MISREQPRAETRLQREIEATDREIDHLVYELYGLRSPGVWRLALKSCVSLLLGEASTLKVGNAKFWRGENYLKMGYSGGNEGFWL